jgi:putative endonuclease
MEKEFWVHIPASKRNGTLYIGVTSDLAKINWEHKNGLVEGFTDRYKVDKLVCCEPFDDAEAAITREEQMQKWRRAWKVDLIDKANPEWRDLSDEING